MGASEQSAAEDIKPTCARSEQNVKGHLGPAGPGRHQRSNYYFAETHVGEIRAGADARKLEPEGVIAVLAQITLDQVRTKRKCSLAIASLIPVDLEKAATALRSLNPAENAVPADIDEARTRLLRRARQARSPEDIEKFHHELKSAAIIK